MSTVPDEGALRDPLAQLEREIAAAESRGEPVPPQAYEMVARLRELMGALRRLSDSLDEGEERPPE